MSCPPDLKEIVVKKGDASIKVWETLFGAHTKLERQGEDYLITYSDEAQLPTVSSWRVPCW